MSGHRLAGLIVAVLAVGGFVACSEDPPMAPSSSHTTTGDMHGMSADAATTGLEPFTFRASLDAFRIAQLPNFVIRSKTRTDIVIQRSVFNPGPGMWHTHPGPSFIYVIEGQIRLQQVTKHGCTKTPVYGPGDAYFEVADQVHRAIVRGDKPAVVLVTRFNIPVGAAFTIPAANPHC
jgi:quercetin dioxygenase-like cupin family protein